MNSGNMVRYFSDDVSNALGTYVYALRDPRDKNIFYVGKGNGGRVFDHFNEASRNNLSISSKTQRIRDIWEAGLDVEWFIIRRQIRPLDGQSTSDESAEEIEAALLDGLAISQNGEALNDQSGRRGPLHGLLNSADVHALGAAAVNPLEAHPVVLVFPIQMQLEARGGPYEATRKTWTKSSLMKTGVLAVGLRRGISLGVYRANSWQPTNPGDAKMMFTGEELADSDLTNKNWTVVTSAASGFWQRGGYLAVEFDGTSRFRLLRGSKNKEWLDL